MNGYYCASVISFPFWNSWSRRHVRFWEHEVRLDETSGKLPCWKVVLFFASELTQWRLFWARNKLTCLLHKSLENMIIRLQISECIKLRQCLVEDVAILLINLLGSFFHSPTFWKRSSCCVLFFVYSFSLLSFSSWYISRRLDLETRRHCYGQFFSNNFSISMSCCQATCGPIVSE